MSQLLTDAELEVLSGLKRPTAQVKWLRDQGINCFIRADGKPSVTWDFVNNPRGMLVHHKSSEPNFGALSNA